MDQGDTGSGQWISQAAHSTDESSGRVTMRTIAEEAGVHVSTVSRILRRNRDGAYNTEHLSETTRRVLRAARKFDYVPDPYAASLRSRRTGVLGVLVPQLNVVLTTIYDGIEEQATQLGYQTLMANTLDQLSEQRRRVDLMMGRRVDGLILADAHLDGDFLDELTRRGIPFVLTLRHAGEYTSVTCDDHEGGRFVGTHLADLGHEVIGIVGGLPHASTWRDRVDGCREALNGRNIQVPKPMVVPNGFGARDGREATEQLLARTPRPSAIFAVNDYNALGAMGALRDNGLEVGRDVAVVGFNDISIAPELPIPLTTVRNPMREMGETAATLMVARLRGEAVASQRLRPQLVVRKSSDPRAHSHTHLGRT